MNTNDRNESSPGSATPQESFSPLGERASATWEADITHTLQLGEKFFGVVGGVVDLARVEVLLAVHTLPKLVMLWLLMMPVMLLTWCAFSVLVAWSVVVVSEQLGFGVLMFFLLQVVLLFFCRWLFVKCRRRMTLPYTRAQIDSFVRSVKHEFNCRSETKE